MAREPADAQRPIDVSQRVQCSSSRFPEVITFDANKVTAEEVVDALREAGGCIVKGLISNVHLDRIERDLRPHLESDKPWEGRFYPRETRRCCGLIGKSSTFALEVVGNPLWIDVCDSLLTSTLTGNWVGDTIETSTSLPQLSNTICFSIMPGSNNQPLHRDDDVHHHNLRGAAKHEIGRDAGIGLFVAGKKSTRNNGATRFIPGSHLWDYSEGPPQEEKAVFAEMQAGDAFFMLSGCFHGGSANRTQNEERLLYSCFFTRGWMRQEENQLLANSIESIRQLPKWLQERIGFGLSRPFLGWVDLANPMYILYPEEEKYRDLW